MKELSNPKLVAEQLLAMPTAKAEMAFQSYSTKQQLDIISSERDPRKREELYYLVADCTELMQLSPTEEVLQVIDTMLGTGMASVLLPCLSEEQMEEILDVVLWKDGKIHQESLDLWFSEIVECEEDELVELIDKIDFNVIIYALHGKIGINEKYRGLMSQVELIDPSMIEYYDEQVMPLVQAIWEVELIDPSMIEYYDEQVMPLVQAIWESDFELFNQIIYELSDPYVAMPEEPEIDRHMHAEENREERINERHRKAGLAVTEEEISRIVDLENLELDFGDEKKYEQ